MFDTTAKAVIDRERNLITITLPMHTPTESKSKKVFNIANAQLRPRGEKVNGEQIVIGVNCYFRNAAYVPGEEGGE